MNITIIEGKNGSMSDYDGYKEAVDKYHKQLDKHLVSTSDDVKKLLTESVEFAICDFARFLDKNLEKTEFGVSIKYTMPVIVAYRFENDDCIHVGVDVRFYRNATGKWEWLNSMALAEDDEIIAWMPMPKFEKNENCCKKY